MKNILLALILSTPLIIFAQETRISNYALGVNYLKCEIIGADMKMYNIHFEKQSTGSITFGGEVFFKTGTTKIADSSSSNEIKSLYFAGPSVLYTDVIFGMLHYKVTANLNIGYMHHEKTESDILVIDKAIYYGFLGKIEGMALVSTRIQFIIGAGLMKGFTESDVVQLDTNSFYHIGLTYMF